MQHFDTTEDPRFTAGIALRPMDRDIFAALADEHLERTRMLDVFPDRPYRVRFIGSITEHHIAAVLIEMHRDGKVDERWTMKGNDITRTVPEDPAAGGTPVRYSLAHGRWQLH